MPNHGYTEVSQPDGTITSVEFGPDWELCADEESGDTFFYNKKTDVTQWDPPPRVEPKPAAAPKVMAKPTRRGAEASSSSTPAPAARASSPGRLAAQLDRDRKASQQQREEPKKTLSLSASSPRAASPERSAKPGHSSSTGRTSVRQAEETGRWSAGGRSNSHNSRRRRGSSDSSSDSTSDSSDSDSTPPARSNSRRYVGLGRDSSDESTGDERPLRQSARKAKSEELSFWKRRGWSSQSRSENPKAPKQRSAPEEPRNSKRAASAPLPREMHWVLSWARVTGGSFGHDGDVSPISGRVAQLISVGLLALLSVLLLLHATVLDPPYVSTAERGMPLLGAVQTGQAAAEAYQVGDYWSTETVEGAPNEDSAGAYIEMRGNLVLAVQFPRAVLAPGRNVSSAWLRFEMAGDEMLGALELLRWRELWRVLQAGLQDSGMERPQGGYGRPVVGAGSNAVGQTGEVVGQNPSLNEDGDAGEASLTVRIQAEASVSSQPLRSRTGDLKSRKRTSIAVDWQVPMQTAHEVVQTPNLAPLLQQCAFLPRWSEQSALTLILTPVTDAEGQLKSAGGNGHASSEDDSIHVLVGPDVTSVHGHGVGRRTFTAPRFDTLQASRGPLVLVAIMCFVLPCILLQLKTRPLFPAQRSGAYHHQSALAAQASSSSKKRASLKHQGDELESTADGRARVMVAALLAVGGGLCVLICSLILALESVQRGSNAAATAYALLALAVPFALQLCGVWLAGFGLACANCSSSIASGLAAAEVMRASSASAREYDGSERARSRWFGLVRGSHEDSQELAKTWARAHGLLLLLGAWVLGGAVLDAVFGASSFCSSGSGGGGTAASSSPAVEASAAAATGTPRKQVEPSDIAWLILGVVSCYTALLGPPMRVSEAADALSSALLTVGLRGTGRLSSSEGPGLWAGELLLLTDRLHMGYGLLGVRLTFNRLTGYVLTVAFALAALAVATNAGNDGAKLASPCSGGGGGGAD